MAVAPLIPASALARTGQGALVVAFSGGLDSTVLLHALAALPAARSRGLRALHVDHGLHPDSAAWAAHCRAACERLGVPLACVRVDVARSVGHGLEASARHARHAAFAQALGDGEVLVLAHHQDDQAETFLLRALRGSGVDGLRAMQPWRPYARGALWRPLLDVPRAALEDYAARQGLKWIEDASNADIALDRNYLRHVVLPALRERWPHADAALARSASLQAEAAALLGAEDAALLAQAQAGSDDTLDLRVVRAWPRARRARVLRRWLDQLQLPPIPAGGIACVEDEVLPARADAAPRFAWAGAELRRWRDLLHADWLRSPLPQGWEARWDGRTPLALPTSDTLALEPTLDNATGMRGFDPPLHVGARRGGERIRLPGRAHSHALKHVLQDLGVPPWIRDRLPLLTDPAGRLLAAGDIAFDAGFANWLRARGLRLRWRSGDRAGRARPRD